MCRRLTSGFGSDVVVEASHRGTQSPGLFSWQEARRKLENRMGAAFTRIFVILDACAHDKIQAAARTLRRYVDQEVIRPLYQNLAQIIDRPSDGP